jgi:hypothetical protein
MDGCITCLFVFVINCVSIGDHQSICCIIADSYEQRGSAYWHSFYKRNTDNFYKDRHYIHLVFPELDPSHQQEGGGGGGGGEGGAAVHLLEVGSGVGNAGE